MLFTRAAAAAAAYLHSLHPHSRSRLPVAYPVGSGERLGSLVSAHPVSVTVKRASDADVAAVLDARRAHKTSPRNQKADVAVVQQVSAAVG